MENLRDSTMPVRYSSLVTLLGSTIFKLKPEKCNDLYELIIEIDENNICFTAKKKEALPTDYFQEVYDFDSILKILKLTKKKCKDLNIILRFLEQAFKRGKINLTFDKNEKNIIYVIVIIPLKGETECKIKLNHIFLNKIKDEKSKFIFNEKENSGVEKEETNIEKEKYPKLKYIKTITNSNDGCHGLSDIFEVFINSKDKQYYLATTKSSSYNICIISLEKYVLSTSLKAHENNITSVRYFYNGEKKEYLISSDNNKILIVWDIINNYNIKHKINTEYKDIIYCNLILFNINKENYIITSTMCESEKEKESSTKIYNLENGSFIKNINKSNLIQIYYLIFWRNKKQNEDYLIELGNGINHIINLNNNELYAELKTENESYHYCGLIYNNNNKDYLCHTAYDGIIYIWDLLDKKLFNNIDTNSCSLDYIIQWNKTYFIIADDLNNAFLIVDIKQFKVMESIGEKHTEGIVCVKKYLDDYLGECLLTGSEDNSIKLWSF